MSKSVAFLFVLVLTASSITAFLPVKAAARVIVVPDDYPTITEAVRNANAGDTIFVKKGTYEEKTLEIDKALSLIGEGAEFTKINLDPPRYDVIQPPYYWGNQTISWFGSSITVYANDFRLQGFLISTPVPSNKAGGEIFITGNRTQTVENIITTPLLINGSNWSIEKNTLLGDINMAGSYSNFTENSFSGTVWASGSYLNISSNNKGSIYLEGSFCIVSDNDLTGGIDVSGDGNTVTRNFVDHASIGIKIVGSDNIIYANRITNCRDDNLFAPGSPPPVTGVAIRASGNNTFYANYVANNTWGADINSFPETNETSTFYHNNFIGNTHQVAAVQKFPYGSDSFDNGKEGNFWSDYNGTDANGDGIGDTPYVIDANRQDRYPLMAPFNISTVTIQLPEWASPPSNPSPEPQGSETEPEPFPTTWVIAAVAVVAAAAIVGAWIYVKKRKL